MQFSYFFLRS